MLITYLILRNIYHTFLRRYQWLKIFMWNLVMPWLNKIVLRSFHLRIRSLVIKLFLTILLLDCLNFLWSYSSILFWSLLHLFTLIYIFISLCIVELMFIEVSIWYILLLCSLIELVLL